MFLSREIDIKLCQNYTKSLYSPYYVTKTSAYGSKVYWSRDTRENDTAQIALMARIVEKITIMVQSAEKKFHLQLNKSLTARSFKKKFR